MTIEKTNISEKFNEMLIYMLAHDLRQPFASLIELSDIITQAGRIFTDEELRQIFETVHRTSSVSLELLNGLLCWYKLNKEGIRFENQPHLLRDMIYEANSLYVIEQTGRNIRVNNSIAPTQLIYGPKEILQFINRNILSNATKHSPKGAVIDVACSMTDEWLTVSFRDHGKGLTMVQMQALFAIHEADQSTVGYIKGAGIAMSICKDMIDKLNGRIWAKSIKGKGTVFYYAIPQSLSADEN